MCLNQVDHVLKPRLVVVVVVVVVVVGRVAIYDLHGGSL